MTITSCGLKTKPASGDFGPARPIAEHARFPREIAAVDLDGDRDVDLAVVSIFDNRVVWFENTDGRGNFGPQQLISNSQELPVAIEAGDIDSDGDLDLLVGSFYDNMVVWFRNLRRARQFRRGGNHQPAEPGTGSGRTWPTWTSDGDLDALVSSLVDNVIAWHENLSGLGNFGPQQIIDDRAGGASDVTTADLDGDGDLDVIGAQYDLSRIVWYRNESPPRGDFTGDGAGRRRRHRPALPGDPPGVTGLAF